MPLSDHEQRILEEIERRLAEDDPAFVEQVGRTDLYTHLARRIRLASIAFCVGLVMIMLFVWSVVVAAIGFVVTVLSAVLLYRYVGQLGRDQLRLMQDEGFTVSGVLGRIVTRFRRPWRAHAREARRRDTPLARRLPPREREVYNEHSPSPGARDRSERMMCFLSEQGSARSAWSEVDRNGGRASAWRGSPLIKQASSPRVPRDSSVIGTRSDSYRLRCRAPAADPASRVCTRSVISSRSAS